MRRLPQRPARLPGGAVMTQDTIKAKVTAIGKKKESVTLVGPEGNSVTIKVKDPKKLNGVKVGDDVEITYTQALAVSVEPAAPSEEVATVAVLYAFGVHPEAPPEAYARWGFSIAGRGSSGCLRCWMRDEADSGSACAATVLPGAPAEPAGFWRC